MCNIQSNSRFCPISSCGSGSVPKRLSEVGESGPIRVSTGASSCFSNLTRIFSPTLRLDSPRREKYRELGQESKNASRWLPTADLMKYLELTENQQMHYNEHSEEERKAFLRLSPQEMEDCNAWHDESIRSLYLKLSIEERCYYAQYSALLGTPQRAAKSRVKEKLKLFLETTSQERLGIIKNGEMLKGISSIMDITKSWTSVLTDQRARQFCSNPVMVEGLKGYLDKHGDDPQAIEELGTLMLRANLIKLIEFTNKAQVAAWIDAHHDCFI